MIACVVSAWSRTRGIIVEETTRETCMIEVDTFLEEDLGAPEKVWKLAKKKIEIDLLLEE